MKRHVLFAFFLVLVVLSVSHAQTPVPSGVPVSIPPAPSSGGAVSWLHANWGVVVAPLIVALMDFAFAVNPKWRSEGLLHWVYLACGGKEPTS